MIEACLYIFVLLAVFSLYGGGYNEAGKVLDDGSIREFGEFISGCFKCTMGTLVETLNSSSGDFGRFLFFYFFFNRRGVNQW